MFLSSLRLLALVTTLATPVSALGQDTMPVPAQGLKEFASKDRGFSARVPGEMTEKVTTFIGPGGKGELQRTYTYAPNPSTVYLILDREMPALAKANAATIQTALENGRKAAEKSLNGKLLNEKKVRLGKYPGLEFQIESASLGVYRSRVYIVDGRMYQVTIMGPAEFVSSNTADEYIDSFKLPQRDTAQAAVPHQAAEAIRPTPPIAGGGNPDIAVLRTAARAAGLTPEDLETILRDRGPVSCKHLADFINGEVKEGRRGKDLKKDVDYFIKVYKEKVGK